MTIITGRGCALSRALLAAGASSLALAAASAAQAATFNNVDDFTDFYDAMRAVALDRNSNHVINITGDILLLSDVAPVILNDGRSLTVNGNGFTIDGGFVYRPFFVSSSSPLGGGGPTVTVNNLNIANGGAWGGGGSGGGMGAGGALFVDKNTDVSIDLMAMTGSWAVGGSGGGLPGAGVGASGGGGLNGVSGNSPNNGGGGLYGTGGFGSTDGTGGGGGALGQGGSVGGAPDSAAGGGGGGLFGVGGAGANNPAEAGGGGGGADQDGAPGDTGGAGGGAEGGDGGVPPVDGQDGQAFGGGGGGGGFEDGHGGDGAFGGGGGGAGGASGLGVFDGDGGDGGYFAGGGGSVYGNGGDGGDFGGGGGTGPDETTRGGHGGFGGGGGGGYTGTGGNGGFGAGGGQGGASGGAGAPGQGGWGGGDGIAEDGGGGAAFGGAIFVRSGGSLTITGAGQLGGGFIQAGGTNSGLGNNGQQAGTGIFLQNATVTFAPGANQTQLINDDIADDTGNPDGNGDGVANDPSAGGRVVKTGAGTLVLNTANTFSGGVTVAEGTLRLGDNAAAGTGAITTTGSVVAYADGLDIANALVIDSDSTQLQVDTGETATHSGVISELNGPRPLEKIGGGALNISGVNTFTGALTVTSGRLDLLGGQALANAVAVTVSAGATLGVVDASETIGSLAGAGSVLLGPSLTLTTGANDADTTFSGVISDGAPGFAGGLTKIGAGTFTISGANTYTGPTAINAGTVVLNGSLASAVSVADGATLRGAGTVGALNATGAVRPGNSVGVINVAGNVTFAAGSSYEVEIEADGDGDLVAATGTGTLNGGAVEVITLDPEGAYRNQTYTILTADGGVSGTFDGVTTTSALLEYNLEYRPTAVLLALRVKSFGTITGSFNQTSAGTAAENLASGGGDASAVFNSVVVLPTDGVLGAFDSLSGEIYAATHHALAENSSLFQSALGGRSGDGAMAGRLLEGRNLWGTLLAESGTVDANSNAGELEHRFTGFAAGLDGARETMDGTLTGGVALGHLDGRASVDARASAAEISSWHAGVYGSWDRDALRVSGVATYTSAEIETMRNIGWAGLGRTAASSRDAEGLNAAIEAKYRLSVGPDSLRLTPLVLLDYFAGSADAAQETGAGALDLTVARKDYDRLEAGAGVAISHSAALDSAPLYFSARIVYRALLDGEIPAQQLALAGAPGAPFAVLGPDAGDGRLELGLGVAGQVAPNLTLSARYEGSLSDEAETHQASLTASLGF